MRIVVDENVSYSLVERLRTKGYDVTSVTELTGRTISDEEVYALIQEEQAVLITRDHHFTNPIRFSAEKTKGIIYIRHGSLKSAEEIAIAERFLDTYSPEKLQGKLVTLHKDGVRIR
jgi:predicted nuclease of predicted toxin-antitoxin system